MGTGGSTLSNQPAPTAWPQSTSRHEATNARPASTRKFRVTDAVVIRANGPWKATEWIFQQDTLIHITDIHVASTEQEHFSSEPAHLHRLLSFCNKDHVIDPLMKIIIYRVPRFSCQAPGTVSVSLCSGGTFVLADLEQPRHFAFQAPARVRPSYLTTLCS